jgi:lysozyme family protein
MTLQQPVGTARDGSIGPMTLAAVRAADPMSLVGQLAELSTGFHHSLSIFSTFGRGWLARTDRARPRR